MANEALKRAQARLDYSTMSMAFAILGEVAQQRGRLDGAATYFTESDRHARQTEHLSIKGTALSNRSESRLQETWHSHYTGRRRIAASAGGGI